MRPRTKTARAAGAALATALALGVFRGGAAAQPEAPGGVISGDHPARVVARLERLLREGGPEAGRLPLWEIPYEVAQALSVEGQIRLLRRASVPGAGGGPLLEPLLIGLAAAARDGDLAAHRAFARAGRELPAHALGGFPYDDLSRELGEPPPESAVTITRIAPPEPPPEPPAPVSPSALPDTTPETPAAVEPPAPPDPTPVIADPVAPPAPPPLPTSPAPSRSPRPMTPRSPGRTPGGGPPARGAAPRPGGLLFPGLLLALVAALAASRRGRAPAGPDPRVTAMLADLDAGRLGAALAGHDAVRADDLPAAEAYRLGRGFESAGAYATARRIYEAILARHGASFDLGIRLPRVSRRPSRVPAPLARALGDRYRDLAPLGSGGMGRTFRAYDEVGGRPVAIKTPSEAVRNDPQARQRFLREARTLARFDHPNLVRVYDVSPEEPPYYTMQLYEGRDLAARLAGGPARPISALLASLVPVAEALGEVHAAGVIHRDLKPSNLFVAEDGRVCIGDFGLALDPDATRLTRGPGALGTAAYMAPEQLAGADVGPAADVYAFGAVLSEALTGAPPVAGRPPALPPGVPPGLAALVGACLDPVPARRPADGAALAAALRDLRAGLDAPGRRGRAFLAALTAAVAGPLHTLRNRADLAARDPAVSTADATREARVAADGLRDAAADAGLAATVTGGLAEITRELAAAPPGAAAAYGLARDLLAGFEVPVRALAAAVAADHAGVCEVGGDGFPPPPVYAPDPAAAGDDLRVVLENLVANARAAGATRVELAVVTADGPAEAADIAALVVRDNGPGFPAALAPRAFRGPAPGRADGRGTGLVTAAGRCRAQGWEITLAQTRPATFEIRFGAAGEAAS